MNTFRIPIMMLVALNLNMSNNGGIVFGGYY